MPELAEVEWYRKQWDVGLGHTVVAVKLHPKKRIFRETDTAALSRELVGRKLLQSQARGKRMLFQFSGDNWVGLHLGMTGKMHIAAASFRPARHDHLVLFQRPHALVFTDSRQFGRVRFHHGKRQPDWWNSTLPEIDSPAFDQTFVDDFLHRHARAPIKAALLMQHGFSGIGNWMADEILWRAKIHPAARSQQLSARKRAALFREAKFVVKQSLGTLGKDFSDPPRTWLIHERWKKGGKCPKHGIGLQRATIGGRTTAWCPRCQKGSGD